MRQRSTIVVALGLLTVLFATGSLRAQNAAPKGFPTGDDQAKQQWIQSNPEAYRTMGGQVSSSPAPSTKLQFSSDADKQAWINAHPAEYAKLVGSVKAAPSAPTMPKFVDTGNPEADALAYSQAKSAWIAAHPKEYAAMTQTAPAAPVKTTGSQKVSVTQAELNDMSPAKRQAVLADPNVQVVK